MMLLPPIERFFERVLVGDDCWEWVGNKMPTGYGLFSWKPNGNDPQPITFRAHRWAYELFVGDIPEGLSIDHLCSNPSCVRPTHLEPVTHAENMRRAVERRDSTQPSVPAPNKQGQRDHGWGEGRTHGRVSTYSYGCRCELCRTAWRLAGRRYRAKKQQLTEKEPA